MSSYTSNFDLEKIFGFPLDEVDEMIANKAEYMQEFAIDKNDGTKRNIIAPTGKLKYLSKGLVWRFFNAYKPHKAANGFVKQKGTFTNAIYHVGAMSVGSIDIRKFFEHISPNHMSNILFGNKRICRMCKNYNMMLDGKCSPSLYFNKSKAYQHRCEEIKAVYMPGYEEATGYKSLIRRVIELCTYKGHCPQGFPTSPAISNIVLKGMDKIVAEFCGEHDIVYTRYADDLAFSSRTLLPSQLRDRVKGKAYKLIEAFDFKPNKKKTKFRGRASRMMVCGVVVNDKTSLPKYETKKIRASVHRACVKERDEISESEFRSIRGRVSYFMSLNKSKATKYMDQLKALSKHRGWK